MANSGIPMVKVGEIGISKIALSSFLLSYAIIKYRKDKS